METQTAASAQPDSSGQLGQNGSAVNTLRAICFDLDGTLADTEPLGHRPAYNRAFREAGLGWRWTPKLYRDLLQHPGGGRDRLRHYMQSYEPEWPEAMELDTSDPEALIRDLHARKAQHFHKIVEKGEVPLRPGVERLIGEASAAGVKLAVVSNASRGTVASLLAHSLGKTIGGQLDVVLCGDEGYAKKPAPDLYLEAMRQLGVQPGEAIAVEDSRLGLRAALEAGMATVVTLNKITRNEDFSGADLVVDSLGEPEAPTTLARPTLLNEGWVTLADLRAAQQRHAKLA